MRKKLIVGTSVAVVAAVAVTFLALRGRWGEAGRGSLPRLAATAEAGEAAPRGETGAAGKGMAAIEHAAKAGKYLFIFFYRDVTGETGAMRKVFHAAMAKASDRAEGVEANVADPSEEALVRKFNVSRAPMPLVLVLAPNGAVTGGFPTEFDEEKLLGAFVSPGMAQCLKGLQQRKLVFVCVQNQATKSNEAAMRGVRDFEADPQYKGATEVVTLDPAKSEDAKLLGQLRVAPDIQEAVTVLLAPPGAVLGTFQGATSKSQIVAMLNKANMACGSGGCGPSSGAG